MPEMKTWMCLICGWIYDEEAGDPDSGIAPGTRWEDVPVNWTCPECGARKEDFEMAQLCGCPSQPGRACPGCPRRPSPAIRSVRVSERPTHDAARPGIPPDASPLADSPTRHAGAPV